MRRGSRPPPVPEERSAEIYEGPTVRRETCLPEPLRAAVEGAEARALPAELFLS